VQVETQDEAVLVLLGHQVSGGSFPAQPAWRGERRSSLYRLWEDEAGWEALR
jgi:hypothetical protein